MNKQQRQARILSLLEDSGPGELASPRDLATMLGVSEVTVRRDLQALTDAGLVHRQHGSVRLPRSPAKQLHPVGILLVAMQGKFSHPFHNAQLEGADQALQALGYYPAFVKTFAEVDSDEAVEALLAIHPIVGLLVIGELELAQQKRWMARVPVVVATSLPHDPASTVILCDGFGGIEALISYLVSLGNRRLAFIMATGSNAYTDDRLKAYQACVKRFELDDEPALLFTQRQALERDPAKIGREGAKALMALATPPEVIVCMSDLIAIGAMQWLQANGFRVPEDVAVTGFDNIAESELTYPPLTTVHVHKQLMGRLAAEQLHRRLTYPTDPPLKILTPTSLVIRGSCAP